MVLQRYLIYCGSSSFSGRNVEWKNVSSLLQCIVYATEKTLLFLTIFFLNNNSLFFFVCDLARISLSSHFTNFNNISWADFQKYLFITVRWLLFYLLHEPSFFGDMVYFFESLKAKFDQNRLNRFWENPNFVFIFLCQLPQIWS